jgi:DMSO/TMAO reductase YedYZ molybdopterin-dependent catalytic subunit
MAIISQAFVADAPRLLVPYLYLWKSAKWVRRLVVLERERRGYWESFGHHDRGDPGREQRDRGD